MLTPLTYLAVFLFDKTITTSFGKKYLYLTYFKYGRYFRYDAGSVRCEYLFRLLLVSILFIVLFVWCLFLQKERVIVDLQPP